MLMLLAESFERYCKMGLETLKITLFEHVVEALNSFEGLKFLKTSLLERINVLMKRAYSWTQKQEVVHETRL